MARVPAPMLASPAGDLPLLEGWIVEPKWDGIRVVAEVTARAVQLWSRNGIDKAHQFPEVSEALEALGAKHGPLVLDGELIAVDRAGAALRFQALQQRAGVAETRTAFIAFDVVTAARKDLRGMPWTARREVLEALVPRSARALVRRGDAAACGSAGAKRILAAAAKHGWEGIILKKADSPYRSGERSPNWRKVKFEHEQEFVVGGYKLPSEGAAREHFGALLVGWYDDAGKLHYAGKVGTGYSHATLREVGKKLSAIEQAKAPFVDPPRREAGIVWVKPQLVAQVRYNEMTDAGILRQPVFLGLRDDKKAKSVRLEAGTSANAILETLRCG